MVNPGIIYRHDTMGNKGLFTLEEMADEKMLLTPYSHTVHYSSSVFEGIRAVWDEGRERV